MAPSICAQSRELGKGGGVLAWTLFEHYFDLNIFLLPLFSSLFRLNDEVPVIDGEENQSIWRKPLPRPSYFHKQ